MEIPTYQGKLTAYLDHNILDVFVKYGMIDFAQKIKENYQVIYSDETLKEIKRSGDYADQFLNVLNELNALHCKLRMNSKFELTNEIIIYDMDVNCAYKQYCEQEPIYPELVNSMLQHSFKSYGGRKGDNFEVLKNEQIDTFSGLMQFINQQAANLEVDKPDLALSMNKMTDIMMGSLKTTLDKSNVLMSAHVADEENWSGVQSFRETMNIGPKELKNISGPDVLEKIWALYKDKNEYKDLCWDVEDFFFIKQHPIYPEKEYFSFEKVTTIYNHLNFIGYYPDSKTHKERRFIAAISDQGHASIASFANILYSRDKDFVIKTRAAYEYLGLNTEVILVNLENA